MLATIEMMESSYETQGKGFSGDTIEFDELPALEKRFLFNSTADGTPGGTGKVKRMQLTSETEIRFFTSRSLYRIVFDPEGVAGG